jgi:hypothetical protein
MTTGMTIKQFNQQHFWRCLDAYKDALRTGNNFVEVSLAVYIACGDMPKKYQQVVRRVFRETKREADQPVGEGV